MKTLFKKATAILLSFLTVFTFISPLLSNAAGDYIELSLISYPRGGGGTNQTWGHPRLVYMDGSVSDNCTGYTAKGVVNKGMQVAYCLQPAVPITGGAAGRVPDIEPAQFLDKYSIGTLTPFDIQQYLGIIFYYGFTGTVTVSMTNDQISELIATQVVIWELMVGERDWDFGKITPPLGYNAVLDSVRPGHPLRSLIIDHYNRIVSAVINHTRMPSFLRRDAAVALTHELTWNGSAYSITLTDTNNALSQFNFSSSTPGVGFTVTGNQLIISVTSPPAGDISIQAKRTGHASSGVLYWAVEHITTNRDYQGMATMGQEITDPINGFLKCRVSTGNLRLVKTSEDGVVADIPFTITGNGVNQTVRTNESGEIVIPNLAAGVYTITEAIFDRYRPQESKQITILGGQTNTVSFENILKKGRIQIIKIADGGGATQIETPEVGAAFQVFPEGKSYDTALPTERDILICDNDGIAVSKLLPYGVYRVRQISGWPGKERMSDFLVFISEDDKTYSFIINNAAISSKIKIEKRNSEDGELIAAAGIGFRIIKPDGSFLTQQISYPTPTDISVFYTCTEGWLMLPQPLEYGLGYKLIEVEAAPGFYLCDEPVSFDVTGETTFITVIKYNDPQKARIQIEKRGEIFSTVTQTADGEYRPEYAAQSLAGAVFEVYADEDIYLNHKLMVRKDTLVATMTTTSSGIISPLLYLGRYRIVERTAPYGFVRSDEVKIITLLYMGQTVKEYIEDVGFYNERQRVKISFTKIMEQDSLFGIGMNGEIAAVRMGLFAEKDIIAADGTMIPKNGLIEIISVDADTGTGIFTADLPAGSCVYLKEIATNERYILSGEKYPVIFEYAGQDIALVELAANNGEPIINEIIRGRIEGVKLGEDKEGLCGALIGLFKTDEIVFTEAAALMTAVSGEDGGFSFEGIPYGGWIIREISAPEGYVLSDESYPITIDEDGAVVEIKLENKLIRGNVKLIKTDKANGTKLTGAKFELYGPDGNLLGIYTTDKNGEIFVEGLPYGFGYKWLETKAPEGYVLDSRELFFDITENDATVEVTATNELIPPPPGDNPRTGGGRNALLYSILMGVSAAAFIALRIAERNAEKRRKMKVNA